MDKATGNKAVIAKGAQFKGKVKNARSIDINGSVEADLKADKVTIGETGEFSGAINAELVVISGQYDGTWMLVAFGQLPLPKLQERFNIRLFKWIEELL